MMKIFNASVSHFQKKKKSQIFKRIIKMTKLSKILSSTIHFELVDGSGEPSWFFNDHKIHFIWLCLLSIVVTSVNLVHNTPVE
jgi:hypothetical protein